jgi:uncharacterized LabA/DUF88 family protein
MRTAFLVDGGFFLHRYQALRPGRSPRDAAADLHWMCNQHLLERRKSNAGAANQQTQRRRRSNLYRIFYYDCPPLTKKAHHPITGKPVDFSKTPLAMWRQAFHEELKKLRKVALRLGYLNDRSGSWTLHTGAMKRLLSGATPVDQLTEGDLKYDVRQKGVDMRIGLDIASMAFKQQVDQMVLVSGDSDFVPAAKLARREGVDFVLDPMWAPIRSDLHEHIDGLRSVISRPTTKDGSDRNPGEASPDD